MDLGLQGKSALITGGERGIGREVALALAKEGANIAYCEVRIEVGPGSTRQQIQSLGVPGDVGSAYAFLASDRASFATGANIVLDGGLTLRPLTLVSRSEIEEMSL